jgi:hypothetical protein
VAVFLPAAEQAWLFCHLIVSDIVSNFTTSCPAGLKEFASRFSVI